jgi:formate-dependent nitrite reductase cytochrome c552 subunit
MPKSVVHLSIDTHTIERCKANKINMSKEVQAYLDNILSKPIQESREIEDINLELRNKEMEYTELQRDINNLKEIKETAVKKEEEAREKALYEQRMILAGKIRVVG